MIAKFKFSFVVTKISFWSSRYKLLKFVNYIHLVINSLILVTTLFYDDKYYKEKIDADHF